MTAFLTSLLSEYGGYLITGLAGVLAVVATWFGGKRTGAAEQRAETQAQINEQAAQARQEVRDVRDQVAGSSDGAVADRLRSGWVRK